MKKKKEEPKKRANKYEKKLSIDDSLDDVLKVSVPKTEKKK